MSKIKSEILTLLKEKNVQPASGGFVSIPAEFQKMKIGEEAKIELLNVSIGVKKDNIPTVKGLFPEFPEFLKNPFDKSLVEKAINAMGNNASTWTYFIGRYSYGEGKEFTYVVPLGFDEKISAVTIMRGQNNERGQATFQVSQ